MVQPYMLIIAVLIIANATTAKNIEDILRHTWYAWIPIIATLSIIAAPITWYYTGEINPWQHLAETLNQNPETFRPLN